MDAVKVICSLVLLLILVVAIIKKFHPVVTLWALGTLTLIIYALVTKGSIVETSSGNAFLDAFEYFKESSASQFAGSGLIIMSVMGYVGYMNYLKAGDLFAVYVAKPLQKIKIKYLAVGLVVFLDWIFVMILPSGIATIALLFGTIYPVLIYLGISQMTAATAIVIGVGVFATPSNFFPIALIDYFKFDEGIAVLFTKYLLPVVIIMEVVYCAFFAFWSKRCDKKAAANADQAPEIPDAKSFGIPWFYAILPVIPFVAIIGFSKLVFSSISISVVAANILSFTIAFIVRLLTAGKPVKETFNEGFEFFKSIGDSVSGVIMIIIAGTFFAGALQATGGLNIICDFLLNHISLPIPIFLIFAALLSAFMYFATGTCFLALYSVCPLVCTAVAAGASPFIIPAFIILTIPGNLLGAAISPISAANMFAASFLDVPVTELIKRMAPPAAVAFIVSCAATFILF